MKKFIINFGTGLIDLCAWLILLGILLSGAITMLTDPLCGIGIFIVGFVLFIAMFYLLYLLIDIKENLDKIVENTTNEKDNTNI